MRSVIIPAVILLLLSACGRPVKKNGNQEGKSTKIKVEEVLQTSNYTYIQASTRGNPELWIAIPKTEIEPGSEYYISEGLVMNNFESKELGRVFDEILFLEELYTEPVAAIPDVTGKQDDGTDNPAHSGAVVMEKQDISVDRVSGGLTIAELFSSPSKYKGKEILVRGMVTKYNADIMGKNWVHIQDGTGSDGQFDLTITTDASVKPGDTVVFQGTVSLDRDFGYGYYYKVLLEDARIVEQAI